MPHDGRDSGPATPRSRVSRLNAVLVCIIVALAAAAAGAIAWTHPTTVSSAIHYQQSGALTYSAPANPTSIYGSTGVATGEPVYSNVVSTVRFEYAYRFTAPTTTKLGGTERLVATISNGQGITRTIPLQPATPFRGDHFTAAGTLSIPALQALSTAFDRAAGNASHGMYAVHITPTVKVHGAVGSLPLTTSFDPAIDFTFNWTMLVPGSPGAGGFGPSTNGGPTTSSTGASTRPMTSSLSGSIARPSGIPARTFLGLSVVAARIITAALFLVSLVIGILLGMPLIKETLSRDERARLANRIGSTVVDVDALPDSPILAVTLSSFNGLAQVARKLECPILHLHDDSGDVYAVVDNGTVYRCGTLTRRRQRTGRTKPNNAEGRHAASEGNEAVASPIRISRGGA